MLFAKFVVLLAFLCYVESMYGPGQLIRTRRQIPFAEVRGDLVDNIATHFIEDELRYYKFPGRPATNINSNVINFQKPLIEKAQEKSFKIPVVTIGHVDNIPGRGNRIGIRSQVELVNRDDNKLLAWIQYQREFYKSRIRQAVIPSTVYGITYRHRDGGEVIFSAAHGPDNKPLGSVDLNWPIIGSGRANVGLAAGLTFGKGVTPRPYVTGKFNFRPKFH